MVQPHSFLWHYLWVGPHALLVGLAFLTWRRGLHKLFPAFYCYLVYEAIQGLTLYALDRLPSVSDAAYWRADIAGLFIEGLVKLAVIWELFSHLVHHRPSVAKLGTRLIICTGAALVALAAATASHAPISTYPLPSHASVLNEVIYIIESGLLLFIFLFAAHHHLIWERRDFGIALGLSVSACFGVFAVYANEVFFKERYLLDFLNMGTYHACVVLWFYYLLSPVRPLTDRAENGASSRKPNGPIDPAIHRLRPAWLALLEG
jgi:hypothetical protein